MAEARLPVRVCVELDPVLIIKPGDHLIVRTEDHISQDQADRLKALIMERLPQLGDVTVLRAHGLAVVRAEQVNADG